MNPFLRWLCLGLFASSAMPSIASNPSAEAKPGDWNLERLTEGDCNRAGDSTLQVGCNSLFTRKLLNEISQSSSELKKAVGALREDGKSNRLENIQLANTTIAELKALIEKLGRTSSEVTPALSRIAREIAQSRQAYEKALPLCKGQEACGIETPSLHEKLEELAQKVDQIQTNTSSTSQRLQAVEDFEKKQSVDAKSVAVKAPSRQLDPKSPIADYYPNASFDVVVIAVPDPRVPRHRRSYEYSLEAIISGMSRAGFDIDRYYFPWQEYAKSDPGAESAVDCLCRATKCPATSDECFGMIAFRHDTWREKASTQHDRPAAAVRLAYLVPETTTYGIPQGILSSILHHWINLVPPSRSAWHSQCGPANSNDERANSNDERLLIVGPSYSGSVNSWIDALSSDARWNLALRFGPQPEKTPLGNAAVCFLSYAATATLNDGISKTISATDWKVSYVPLAKTDQQKIDALFSLVDLQKFQREDLAFVYEESTYGVGIKKEAQARCGVSDSCKEMRFASFLSNLSEIRARRAAMSNHSSSGPLGIAGRSTSLLPLDDSVENGSEYPTSRQSPLNSAAAELTLDRLLRTLNASGGRNPPRMIAIAATDVRDRLYLVQRLKQEVPSALLVDLEADALLSHPDFVSATRGMLQLQSAPLRVDDGGEIVAFQTDDQNLLREAICSLEPSSPGEACSADGGKSSVRAAIVGRNWLQPFDYSTPNSARSVVSWIRSCAHLTAAGIVLACWFGLGLMGKNRKSVRQLMLSHFGKGLCGAAIAALALALLVGVWVIARAILQISSVSHALDAGLAIGFVSLALATRRWVRVEPAEGDPPLRHQIATAMTESRGIRLAFTGVLLAIFGVSFALPPLLALMYAARTSPSHGDSQILDLSITTGVAVAQPFLGALTLCAIAILILSAVVVRGMQAQKIWADWVTRIGLSSTRLANTSMAPFVAVICLGSLLFVMLKSYPLAANAWAPMYDGAYYLSVLAATIVSSACLTMCISTLETITRSLRYVRWYAAWQQQQSNTHPPSTTGAANPAAASASSTSNGPSSPFDREWSAFQPTRVPFVVTPLLCLPASWDRVVGAGSGAVQPGDVDTFDNRVSLARMFSRWIWNIRSMALLIFLNCFGVVLLIYSYPVPSRDLLLMVTMGIMVATSLFCVMAAIYFERNSILSRLLCDRSDGIQWSWTFVITLVLPFLLLAVMVLITEVPGVREWTGSYLAPVLRLLGFSAG